MKEYFGDIVANASNWFSDPIKIVAICIFIFGFMVMILSPKIDKIINKRKKGSYSRLIKIIGWIILVVATFLAII